MCMEGEYCFVNLFRYCIFLKTYPLLKLYFDIDKNISLQPYHAICDTINVFVRSRSRWLKEPHTDSTELFRMVAEIFILWCKSHVKFTILSNINFVV